MFGDVFGTRTDYSKGILYSSRNMYLYDEDISDLGEGWQDGDKIRAPSNMMSKQTGQLSLTTNFLTFAGSLARVFTTIQDVGYDASLLCNCTTNAVLSGVLVIQVVFFLDERNCFLDAITILPLSFCIRNFSR